jgi:hypothetical protein
MWDDSPSSTTNPQLRQKYEFVHSLFAVTADYRHRHPILVCHGASLRQDSKSTRLYDSGGIHFELNPDTPKARELRAWYDSLDQTTILVNERSHPPKDYSEYIRLPPVGIAPPLPHPAGSSTYGAFPAAMQGPPGAPNSTASAPGAPSKYGAFPAPFLIKPDPPKPFVTTEKGSFPFPQNVPIVRLAHGASDAQGLQKAQNSSEKALPDAK